MRNKPAYFLLLIIAVAFLFMPRGVGAEQNVNVYFFYGDGCPHCAKEETFLDKLEKENQNIKVSRYEVWSDSKNAALLTRAADALKIQASGVPVTIIGDRSIVGFYDETSTGVEIKNIINDFLPSVSNYTDVVGNLIKDEKQTPPPVDNQPKDQPSGSSFNLPILGSTDLKALSLPALTAIIGLLDSLNPCAMWVLLFLISLLFGMENKSKMWLLGGTFIVASAAAYFVFLAAWLNIYLFIGFVSWLKTAIALFAVGSGAFYLKKYWVDRKGGCSIEESDRRKKIIERLKDIASDKRLVFAIFGIAALGISINLIELLCSAGLPAVYVPILTMAGLAKWKYYLYLLLYVFFYILPQLVIFLIAMFSLRLTAISSRVTKYSNLVGGILMLALGLIMLFRPSLLTFG